MRIGFLILYFISVLVIITLLLYQQRDPVIDDGYTNTLSCTSSDNETIMIDYDANNWDGSEMNKQDAIKLMQLDMSDMDGDNWICK